MTPGRVDQRNWRLFDGCAAPGPGRRKKTVKDRGAGVKKPSTARLPTGKRADAGSGPESRRPVNVSSNGDSMSVLIYIVLTVAIFALLGLVQRLVERL
ncbi:uncharacterized protein RMCB_2980 [Mycolicibacterium brisbanense]|uniref:Uncharacterized protein n=1 Tax=Mycolicibacterium brisbanense TaxID=146020 RepID=A0A100VZJ6_9MYCO|nr:uncharacterized protein RMCB_2980 [Mycolicibacterium brisbanense]